MDDKYKCKQCEKNVDTMAAFSIRDSGLCFDCYNEGPGAQRKAIREEDRVHEGWFANAAKVKSPEELVAFMQRVMDGHMHSYGTVCHAIAACAVAAAWCANSMKGANGGITGFQAGAVLWGFIRHWQGLNGPARLVRYEDMLYPQYAERFDKTIDESTATWLREEAKKKLSEQHPAAATVTKHWLRIVAGHVPFGFVVRKDG